MQVLSLPGYISNHLTALYFSISISIFSTQLIFWYLFDGLLQSICFRMFCSKHSITFENMYLVSCWFHCVDILYIKFRWHTRIPGLWTQELDAGLWTLDSGRWTLDAGHWTLDSGIWILDSGRWTLDSGRWTLDSEHWTLDSRRWALDVGCFTLDAALLALDTIVDCFRTKSEASFWFCLIKLLKILWVRISKYLMITLVR